MWWSQSRLADLTFPAKSFSFVHLNFEHDRASIVESDSLRTEDSIQWPHDMSKTLVRVYLAINA